MAQPQIYYSPLNPDKSTIKSGKKKKKKESFETSLHLWHEGYSITVEDLGFGLQVFC